VCKALRDALALGRGRGAGGVGLPSYVDSEAQALHRCEGLLHDDIITCYCVYVAGATAQQAF
jgi:hypothetical protein